jgi:hypothetical protein
MLSCIVVQHSKVFSMPTFLFSAEPDEEHTLRIDGTASPTGILAYKVPNLTVGNELVNAIQINIPLHDIREFTDTEVPFTAELMPDGGSILITCPSTARYFMDDMRAVWATAGNPCQATIIAHQAVVTGILSNENRRVKKVMLHFPDEITCKNDHFGLRSGSGRKEVIKTELLMTKVIFCKNKKGNDISFEFPWVSMKVTIDDDDARYLVHEAVETVSDIMKRMKIDI